MKEMLQYYYSGTCFPFKLIQYLFTDGFKQREFCYGIIEDNKEKIIRQKTM